MLGLAVLPDGSMLASFTSDGQGRSPWSLTLFDASTGAKTQTIPVADAYEITPVGLPVFSPDGKAVYVKLDNNTLTAYQLPAGSEKWHVLLDSLPMFALSPDGATVYAGAANTLNGNLLALDAATGKARWTFATGGVIRSAPAVSPDSSSVFIGVSEKLLAFDAASGSPQWAFAAGDWLSSSPAVAPTGSAVYVGSDDSHLYAVDAMTGNRTWSLTTSLVVTDTPVLSPDGATLYMNSDHLYAIKTKGSPSYAWSFGAHGPPTLSPDGSMLAFPAYNQYRSFYALYA